MPIAALSVRLRTRPRGEQRGPTAQLYFVKPSSTSGLGGVSPALWVYLDVGPALNASSWAWKSILSIFPW